MSIVIIDVALLLLLVATAVIIVAMTRLITAGLLFGIYSLLMATLFIVLDAVDVAFTEAAVGAGVSTILILATLAITGAREEAISDRRIRSLALTLALGIALIAGTWNLPDVGTHDTPTNNHLIPRYLVDSADEIGIPNVVTSVLASYRGYDTLGEVTVIFAAGMGVLCLLAGRRRRSRHTDVEQN